VSVECVLCELCEGYNRAQSEQEDTPVKLSEVRARPNERIVAALEECLREAKEGKIQSFAIVQSNPDGDIVSQWGGNEDAFDSFRLIGGLETIKWHLMRASHDE
jgi:hypothetical protein